jgi:hypothetical protein
VPDSSPDRPPPQRRTPAQLVLAAGGLAAAVASIVGLGSTARGWFDSGPPGEIDSLKIRHVRSLTYGQWLDHEKPGASEGLPKAMLDVPGKMVNYDLVTHGFNADDKLRVRLIVNRAPDGTPLKTAEADPIRGSGARTCGCFDWVEVPRARTRYTIEVAVWEPGKTDGEQPAKSEQSPVFTGTGTGT